MSQIQTRRTACPLDCPDSCQLEISVEAGRVVKVDADPNAANPLTQGFLCGKVRGIAKHLECKERVLKPLIRTGAKGSGEFREASWEEALDRVEAGLRAAIEAGGPTAVLPVGYGGSNGLLTQDAVDSLFFRRLGSAQCLRTLCAMPSSTALTAMYGRMPGVALNDLEHANLIVIWGTNLNATGIHGVPIVQRARERGAKLIVVDPRRIPLAKQADLHLAPKPGTDLPLALALAGELFRSGRADRAFLAKHAKGVEEFERAATGWSLDDAARECGMERADLEQFVELFADARPAALRIGWGQERNRSGGWASAAILALPAVAGHFGVRGGGYTASQMGPFGRDLREGIEAPAWSDRKVNLTQLGRGLTEDRDDPIRAAFVYNGNPLVTCPDQNSVRRGLEREDLFTVVHDAVLTDTALYADVVLPATTFLEHDEVVFSFGVSMLMEGRAAVPAYGEARSNMEVFGELARRFGLLKDESELDPRVLMRRALDRGGLGEQRERELAEKGHLKPEAGIRPVPFVDSFPGTRDQLIDLWPVACAEHFQAPPFEYRADPRTAAEPLTLISPALSKTISSTFAQLLRGVQPLAIHPADARERGLEEGAVVRVFNRLGEMRVPLHIDDDLRPGVVCFPKGMWTQHSLDGNTSNALIPDSLTDLGAGSCFNDARVEVELA